MVSPHETIVKTLKEAEQRQLNESARRSMSRVASHIANRHVGMMTAWRSGNTPEENNKRNDELKADFKKHGIHYIPVRGRYTEGFGTSKQKDSSDEKSFMVLGKEGEDNNRIKNFLVNHGKKYGQDSVLYKHPSSKTAQLLGTNEGGFPGAGKSHDVGEFHPDRAAEFHSVLTRGGGNKLPGQQPAKRKVFSFGEEAEGSYIDEEGNLYEGFFFVTEISFFARKENMWMGS
jgi:hypothetical protein